MYINRSGFAINLISAKSSGKAILTCVEFKGTADRPSIQGSHSSLNVLLSATGRGFASYSEVLLLLITWLYSM